MLPYFAPAFLALVAFLVIGPRTREGGLGVVALLLFAFISIRVLPGPTNWYGGGGTVGNRYFMAALPLAMLFLPRGLELVVAGLGLAASFLFLGPAWSRPVEHTLHPALLASRPGSPITYLRAERAMLNDLSFCTDPWRKKQAWPRATSWRCSCPKATPRSPSGARGTHANSWKPLAAPKTFPCSR